MPYLENQPPIGPGQPFQLLAIAYDPDELPLPLTHWWNQTEGPDSAHFDDPTRLEPIITCDSIGEYTFQLSVSDGVATVSTQITIVISNLYRATAAYTATCPWDKRGNPTVAIASYLSVISLEDAQAQAQALAAQEAEAQLYCVDNEPPRVRFNPWLASVQTTVTAVAACESPFIGKPIKVNYTLADSGRPYDAVQLSAYTVAIRQARRALVCTRGNHAPVVRLAGFDYSVSASATATASCQDIDRTKTGPVISASYTFQGENLSFREAERRARLMARTQALANLSCSDNLAPIITLSGVIPSVSAWVTTTVSCPWNQKGAPVTIRLSRSSTQYPLAETSALAQARAVGDAAKSCAPNIPPSAFISTEQDLTYRAQVAYRNNNWYRAARTTSKDFLYLATATAGARCPEGTYGPGAYATAIGQSHDTYLEAEKAAQANALASAQARLQCSPKNGRIILWLYHVGAAYPAVDTLGIFRLTKGTLASPERRLHFLGAYPLPISYGPRFTDTFLDLSDFNDVRDGNENYVFYLGKHFADDTFDWLENSVQFRLDTAYPAESVNVANQSAAPDYGILSAREGVIALKDLEHINLARLSVARAPYLALDAAGWCDPGEDYTGVVVFQTDMEPALASGNILASGLVALGPYDPASGTEEIVLPIPFIPVFSDETSPLIFLFYYARATPEAYTLGPGWPVGPPGGDVPLFQSDVTQVAWTYAASQKKPPYTVSSVENALTLPSPGGKVVLPAAASNVALLARTEDCKLIIRRYRQRLF